MAEPLPLIDVFDVLVNASAREVFQLVTRRMGRGGDGAVARAFTFVLGCVPRGRSYTVPPVAGQEANGFRVAEVIEPKRLVLEGRHRFAIYRLSFLIDPLGENQVVLRARTEALFLGTSGAIYRWLVIGSGAHEIMVKRMLTAIARLADPLNLER